MCLTLKASCSVLASYGDIHLLCLLNFHSELLIVEQQAILNTLHKPSSTVQSEAYDTVRPSMSKHFEYYFDVILIMDCRPLPPILSHIICYKCYKPSTKFLCTVKDCVIQDSVYKNYKLSHPLEMPSRRANIYSANKDWSIK